jgi:beta-glucosidase
MYAGYNRRLQIPPLSFTDGPRGIVMGQATAFPVAMARGASWDIHLEQRVADAIACEARAAGANYFAGICVNLLRHPGWGRAQETWGEDSFHVGEMAAACVQAVQRHNVMACVKHFAVNSIENNRFYVDVRIDERALHEVFLPQFKRCVDAGAASLMSAYNQVNGNYCAHQRWLLDDILRRQWGFTGFVSSDWLWGVFDAAQGVNAGLDVEMPYAKVYGRELRRALRHGQVSMERIDRSVHRILETRLAFASRPDPELYPANVLACDEHILLAQEAAEQSMVLLENHQHCLPLSGVKTLAVIGDLAMQANTGDHGSSRTSPPFVITLLDGLCEQWDENHIIYHDGMDVLEAAAVAASCDAAVIVAGNYPHDEGENLVSNHAPGQQQRIHKGGDRESLALPAEQVAMIRAVGTAQPRSTVVLVGGSAIITCDWRESVNAIVMAWYPGMMGGRALARLLAGEINFSGHLPFAWPAAANQLPEFKPFAVTADYGYHHGYTWFDETQQMPAYAFGMGLSYTAFACSDLRVAVAGDALQVTLTVHNQGARAGRAVVQCYVGSRCSPVPVHHKRLRSFMPVDVAAGCSQSVVLIVPLERLRRWDTDAQGWLLDAGAYAVWAGLSSDERECQNATVTVSA